MSKNHKIREKAKKVFMVDIKIIQNRIIETIKNCGYTQTQLSKMLNISQSCIAHYIKGDIMPSLDTLANLCIICDVSPAYILCFDEKE